MRYIFPPGHNIKCYKCGKMSYKHCLFALLLAQLSRCESDGRKWVWGDGNRNTEDRLYTGLLSGDRKYTGELISSSKPLFQPSSTFGGSAQGTKLRYEVTEPTYIGPEQYRPERPILRPGGSYQPLPEYNRPDNFMPPNGFRPMRPIENEYRPIGPGLVPPPNNQISGGYRPMTGPNGRPILTGPVPSWEQNNPHTYKDYDKCKCVHSFNCNTPGIKFGSCDIDKQYCCYKARGNNGVIGGPKPDKPRPVLAGPGGPIDGPQRPNQNYDRPFRPFSDIDRYIDRDLDEAYKKGLASAIYELYERPGIREQSDTYNPNYYTPKTGQGYGLYEPSGYGGRSANITAIPE